MNEMRQPYHHKDLRNSLIEKGIEMVNVEGVHSFSLRKVAAACQVSHAAPYSHFRNKAELLDAMQLYITDQFSELLETTIRENKNSDRLLSRMGIAYVSFFVEHPTYFQFLYSRSTITVDLTLSIPDEENYKPYILYKDMMLSLLDRAQYPKEKQNDALITIWSFIHGITSLATMQNVRYDHDWKQKVVNFMEIFQLSFLT